MLKRASILTVVVALLLGLVVTTAYSASAPVVQKVDSSQFPKIVLNLLLQPEMMTSTGRPPEVFVTENGEDVSDVLAGRVEAERKPIDVAIVLDTSGSMRREPIADAIKAAHGFVNSLREEDQLTLVSFASDPTVHGQLSFDRQAVHASLDTLEARGQTALYDGLVAAAATLENGTAEQRYIIVLSDGGDTMSINSANNATKAVQSSGATVFAVVLESPDYDPKPLRSITSATGGRTVTTRDSAELESIYALIAETIGQSYRVEFTSTRPNTADIEYAVRMGADEGSPSTVVTVKNPSYQDLSGSPADAMVRPVEDPVSLWLFAGFVMLTVTSVAAAVGLYIVRERPTLEQLDYYSQEMMAAEPEQPAQQGGGQSGFGAAYDSIRDTLIVALGEAVERRGMTGKIQRQLDLAGVALRANEFLYIIVLTVAVSALALGTVMQSTTGAALGAGIAVIGPIVYLRLVAERRLKKFQTQLPAIMDLLSGSLRSGWGLQQAVDLVVDEVDEPAKSHFRRAQIEARLGLPFDEALQRMAQRVESPDLHWAVNAISIQREVGGNLAEVLSIVSNTMRERTELAQEVKTLTAEGRVTMIVLTIVPIGVFTFLMINSREFVMDALAEPLGVGGYVLALVLLIVGVLWMRRTTKIEV